MIWWGEPLLWFVLIFGAAQVSVVLWLLLKPLYKWWREHVRIVGRR